MTDPDATKEVEVRELRAAAVHECAHAVMTQRFGGVANPFIWRNLSGNQDEKAWLGTCTIVVEPDSIDWSDLPAEMAHLIKPTPDNWRVLVGLAGVVAEAMDRSEDTADAWEVIDLIYINGISPTDAALVGADYDYGYDDIETLMNMLREEWSTLISKAELLMSDDENHAPPDDYVFKA